MDAIGASLKELEAVGYIVRNRLRDERGRITDTEYIIYEKPQVKPVPGNPDTAPPSSAPPYTENPYMDISDMGSPCTEKPALLNTNQVIPKKTNKNISNTHGSSIHPINPTQDARHQAELYGHIDRGSRKASLDTLVRIANALDTTTDQLLADSLKHRMLT